MNNFPFRLLSRQENELFKKLNTPEKVQDFLNTFKPNYKDTVQSVKRSLASRKVHCLDGAMLASAILWYHGEKPLLMDLKTTKHDKDHVVALFRRRGYWGAISATSHSVLRYRDPIYKTLRELALSYFHEYFLNSGKKTLTSFSAKPFTLSTKNNNWINGDDKLYEIGAKLDDAKHIPLLPRKIKLRYADRIEVRASNTR